MSHIQYCCCCVVCWPLGQATGVVQLICFRYSLYNEGCRLKGLQPEQNRLGLKKVMIELCQATSKAYTVRINAFILQGDRKGIRILYFGNTIIMTEV